MRKEVIEQNRQGDAVELDNENDRYDQHLKAPAINSVKEPEKLANQISEFANWHEKTVVCILPSTGGTVGCSTKVSKTVHN